MKPRIRLVLCTFPDRDVAARIGRILVESRHAACVNLLPGVNSIYQWQGRIETAEEVLALFKTSAPALDAMIANLAELHPYDVPEIIAVNVDNGAAPYLQWVAESCRLDDARND